MLASLVVGADSLPCLAQDGTVQNAREEHLTSLVGLTFAMIA